MGCDCGGVAYHHRRGMQRFSLHSLLGPCHCEAEVIIKTCYSYFVLEAERGRELCRFLKWWGCRLHLGVCSWEAEEVL